MKNFTIYLAVIFCLFLSKINAQESFEERAKNIALQIESITKDEKAALKTEVEAVNQQLIKGTITKDEADLKKKKLAEARAINIESKVAIAEEELKNLVQEKVDGKIKERDTTRSYRWVKSFSVEKNKSGTKRTTSQLVIATGANNLVTDGAIANSDFGYLNSVFWEIGLTYKTRILKNNNLLHFKYGLTGVYNFLSATDNRYFVDNGTQTALATYPVGLKRKDSYFKNVYITIPMHLEFDFSKKEIKDGKSIFKTQQGFRFGIGGFVGYNTNSKQFLSYEVNNYKIRERQKGNWNISDWNYGLSTYVGYKSTSLYLKYDLNPMFKNNVVKQNNISLGIRWDFN